MSQKIKATLLQALPVIIIATLLVVAIIYAWTEPSTSPPGGNVPAPINVGSASQYKSGALGVGGLLRGYSNAIFDGNVGIGTTNPQRKLSIVSTDKTNSIFSLSSDEAGGAMLTFDNAQGGGLANIVAGAYWNGIEHIYGGNRGASRIFLDDGQLHFITGAITGTGGTAVHWNERLTILNNGNVGIGTMSPITTLDVVGDIRAESNSWGSCAWYNVGYNKSHNWDDSDWCPNGTFITQMDFDACADCCSCPIVARVKCCRL